MENRALSTPRSGEQMSPRNDMKIIASSSAGSGVGREKRSRQSTSIVVMPQNKRRRLVEGDKTVVVYNLPVRLNCKKFARQIERWIAEIRGVEVEVVTCRLLPPFEEMGTVVATFRDSDEARLALSLNGIKYLRKTLHAKIFDPDKKSKERKGLINEKQELCFLHFRGLCRRGMACIYAHGLTDLRLYNDTVLDESRCVYINELPDTRSAHLVKAVLDRYKENKIDPYVTYFQHRKSKGDAFFEFANPSHAKIASEILDGLWSIGVHPWKPAYQSVFVAHFGRDTSDDSQAEHQNITDDSNQSPCESDHDTDSVPRSGKSNRPPNSSREEEGGSNTRAKPTFSPNVNRSARTPDQNECTAPKGKNVRQDENIAELKETIISLREELLQTKTDAVTTKEKANDLSWKCRELTQDHTYNLQKIETLEKDNADLERLLEETKDDVNKYRDSERSYERDYRSMDDKIDQLKRENDSLRRQLSDSKCEQEQAKKRIKELDHRLGSATDRNNIYLKDLKDLREKVQQLENTNRELQRQERKSDSLEVKLKESMSKNERLAKALHESNEKVDQLDYANHHLRKEKEAMIEDLGKLREKQDATAKCGLSSGVGCKVKLEPST